MNSATVSACGKYRYNLTRIIEQNLFVEHKGTVVFILLNPSTADADIDDMTSTKCIRYATDWGYSKLVIVNLYAFRSTNPDVMLCADDPVGPENDRYILEAIREADLVVCGWGANAAQSRVIEFRSMMRNAGVRLHYLEMTLKGQPKHPLYLAGNLLPKEWA